MTLNLPAEESSLVGSIGNGLEKVKELPYLGAQIATTERIRKAIAQAVYHKVEFMQLYGTATLTLTISH